MTNRSSTDGSFSLFYQQGWAWLVVNPPKGKGRPVYLEDIENKMKVLRMPKVERRVIRDCIEASSGKPERLVEWSDAQMFISAIHVSVDETSMNAYLVVDAPRKGAAPPTAEEILDTLHLHNVEYGIDHSVITRIVEKQEYGKKVVVARGTLPVHGEGSRVVYHFNVNRGKPYLEMDFGRIDLKELNFIENKEKDELLAELASPVHPVNGCTVTGIPIPAETAGENAILIKGTNTYLSKDCSKIFASVSGNVKIGETGEIYIEPVVTLENVNYETGNIHFDGTVLIKGNIADGFTVEAGGDIQVVKGVGKAILEAGGNILLKSGMTGNNSGSIDCKGNLFAKYIENAKVVCQGHLFIEEAIMNSQISVGKNCIFNGKRAEMLGGTALVGGSFWCKKLGNLYDLATNVTVATRPDHFLSYHETQTKLEACETALDEAQTRLSQFEKAILNGRDDEKILLAKTQVMAEISGLTADIAELRSKLFFLKDQQTADRNCFLVAEDTIYHGVTIVFGKMEFRVPAKGLRKTVLRTDGAGILESGYNYWERPKINFD